MPLIALPTVLQRDEHSCGAAVFACVTGYWEGRGRRLRSHPIHGTPVDQLEPAFRSAGYSVLSGELDVGALRVLTALGWPVCCLIQSDGCGHWVAVRGVQRGRVHLMDPAEGVKVMPLPEWEACWHDADRRGTVYRRHGLAVWC
jgi:ABC-type bacteriocin/lantibiotic exporter with double-glycine peptidase domain